MAGGGIRETKPRPTPDLPEEIIHKEILTRIPIKSVVRFKSVSKSWLTLFSDPQFKKEHHTRTTSENPNAYDCLVVEKDGGIFILSRYEETRLHPSFELIGSVQGIVCLLRCGSKEFVLWNPAIHLWKKVSLPHLDCDLLSHMGLCFDTVSNDYKVLVCYMKYDFRYASVYSCNSDSWTDLLIPDYLIPKNEIPHTISPNAIVDGCPFWKFTRFCNTTRIRSVFVVKFDARTNGFKLLPPFNPDRHRHRKSFKFVNMKNDLVLMEYNLMEYEPDHTLIKVILYSLNGEKGCWVRSRTYTIDIGSLDISGQIWLAQGFEYGGEIVFYECGKFFCYDPKTDTIKHILHTSTHHLNSSVRCFKYTPSLVFLQGMKPVESQTPSHVSGH